MPGLQDVREWEYRDDEVWSKFEGLGVERVEGVEGIGVGDEGFELRTDPSTLNRD